MTCLKAVVRDGPLLAEFCRRRAPDRAAGDLSSVPAEWSDQNGLSVQVRPEYACKGPEMLEAAPDRPLDSFVLEILQQAHRAAPSKVELFVGGALARYRWPQTGIGALTDSQAAQA